MIIEIKVVYIYISIACISLLIILVYLYRLSIRIKNINDLPNNIKDIQLKGIVTSVSDGDGFKFCHMPVFRKLSKDTLNIRLAGIDAPETRSFKIPAQPLSDKSKECLENLVLNRYVTIELINRDRYNRLLCLVYIKNWCNSLNINLEMLRKGMACVYTGSDGVYGNLKNEMLEVEQEAKKNKIGMWSLKNLVLPLDYKKAHRKK